MGGHGFQTFCTLLQKPCVRLSSLSPLVMSLVSIPNQTCSLLSSSPGFLYFIGNAGSALLRSSLIVHLREGSSILFLLELLNAPSLSWCILLGTCNWYHLMGCLHELGPLDRLLLFLTLFFQVGCQVGLFGSRLVMGRMENAIQCVSPGVGLTGAGHNWTLGGWFWI